MLLDYTAPMTSAIHIPRYTLDEYLAMEPEGEVRHEYINGEIFAMVVSSLPHNIIVMNLGTAIRPHLRGTACRVVANDRKVLIAPAQRVYYPDLLVSCGKAEHSIDVYTETQPVLIVEVLSKSTARIDRQQKRLDYQMLDSLQDYVLVAQTERLVEVYSRQAAEHWTQTVYRDDDRIELPSIELSLPMAVIYEDVEH